MIAITREPAAIGFFQAVNRTEGSDGAKCSVIVTFTPTATGSRVAALSISDGAVKVLKLLRCPGQANESLFQFCRHREVGGTQPER